MWWRAPALSQFFDNRWVDLHAGSVAAVFLAVIGGLPDDAALLPPGDDALGVGGTFPGFRHDDESGPSSGGASGQGVLFVSSWSIAEAVEDLDGFRVIESLERVGRLPSDDSLDVVGFPLFGAVFQIDADEVQPYGAVRGRCEVQLGAVHPDELPSVLGLHAQLFRLFGGHAGEGNGGPGCVDQSRGAAE